LSDIIDEMAKYLAETYNGGDWNDLQFYTEAQKEVHRKRARIVYNMCQDPYFKISEEDWPL